MQTPTVYKANACPPLLLSASPFLQRFLNILTSILLAATFSAFAAPSPQSINEEKFITIGGIEQWVTIKGNDASRPIILFLHGGPGSVMTPFADAVYGDWQKDFVLVNWDQRGAGRTFGRNAPATVDEEYWIENPLTVDQMAADGIELTKYLMQRLGKKKVILIGTSWGSLLGAAMILKAPELFHAYIGHSQVVSIQDGFRTAYDAVSGMAVAANDSASVATLHAAGPPPYANARNYGLLLRIIKKYERKNSAPAPEAWWTPAPAYDNERDGQSRYDGDDYSFINLVGHEAMNIKSMVSGIDFRNNGLTFRIPVYIIQGAHDLLTPAEITKPWFDKVVAPKKEFILIPDAAHGHNASVISAQLTAVKKSLAKK